MENLREQGSESDHRTDRGRAGTLYVVDWMDFPSSDAEKDISAPTWGFTRELWWEEEQKSVGNTKPDRGNSD